MGVSLYTSRVVLRNLGVEDYGLYNVIGGVVVMLSFINSCAAGATSRFLTFSLGSKKGYNYQQIFSAAFYIHVVIALIIALLGETIGLWYVTNKMVIPIHRMDAALWVFQLSILSCFVSFTQVPYNASIIAHEKMNVYAYVGIYEAIGKLGVAYILSIGIWDNLKLYAVLLFLLTVSISLFYRYYCVKKFGSLCSLIVVRDKRLYSKLLSYSGWDLIGCFSGVARSQGVNLILNLFCGPVVNAARAVTYQVEAALYSFVQNYLTATRPVIIKYYAGGEMDKMIRLLHNTCKFAFLMFSCLAIPIIIESDSILDFWLVNPPEYASIFIKIILVNYLVISITNSINIGVQATGDVKRLNIYAGSKVFVELPVVYCLLKYGYPPYSAFLVLLVGTIFVVGIDLWVLKKIIVQFSCLKFFLNVICVIITIIILPTLSVLMLHFSMPSSLSRVLLVFLLYWIVIAPLIFYWGISKDLQRKIISNIRKKCIYDKNRICW